MHTARSSLHGDMGAAHELAPLARFAVDVTGEFLRAGTGHDAAHLVELAAHLGLFQDGLQRLVELATIGLGVAAGTSTPNQPAIS